MTPSDKEKFAEVIRATMSLYDREVQPAAMLIWWGALKDYGLAEVGEALARFIKSPKGHFAPLPADVIAMCRKSSGHMPPDEAWAIGLTAQDESLSVIWTTQIAEAMGAAQPCLDGHDKYGARLAFLSAYDRLTGSSAPVWTISIGSSPDGRLRAVDSALRKGLIAPESALNYLPYDCDKIPSVSGLLPAPPKTDEQIEFGKRVLAMLRETLA